MTGVGKGVCNFLAHLDMISVKKHLVDSEISTRNCNDSCFKQAKTFGTFVFLLNACLFDHCRSFKVEEEERRLEAAIQEAEKQCAAVDAELKELDLKSKHFDELEER